MYRTIQGLFFTLLLISVNVYASQVHEYQLKNGLKLLVKEDHRAPIVVSQVWYKVGSSYEPKGITGISHALEHMMFRGSEHYGPGEFSRIIADNGGEQNAFTSYDYTAYYELLSADKLPIAFQLEADRMRHLLLRPQDYKNEIQVVMEERRMRTDDNPQALTYERFMAQANINNPPYYHAPIGWMPDLQKMKVEDLRAWYQRWYAPNNAIVVVVGDVNPEKVYQWANEYFGKLQPTQLPAQTPAPKITDTPTHTLTVQAPAKLPWLVMGYNTPVLKTTEKPTDIYALLVLSGILAQGDSARLERDLVRDQRIAASVDAGYDPYARLNNVLTLSGTPAEGHTVQELYAALQAQVKKLQDSLVTPQELERVKAQVIANKVFQEDSIAYQANEMGSLMAVGLPWQEADNYVKKIQAVTPEQIQAVARQYLTPQRLTVAILKPLPMKANTPQPVATDLGAHDVH
jgi:zinc protease